MINRPRIRPRPYAPARSGPGASPGTRSFPLLSRPIRNVVVLGMTEVISWAVEGKGTVVGQRMEGWLCPALLLYYEQAPR